ncbi:hypothetical protein K491DRAFT_782176 [Lophiostoma macrostomum CBS 122681]|uniref:G domain-containing protein n=1 Tax=Lophiostoma macrostomum CBS 122681 TaxID=1314788 RepID=A0A6A6STC6_9PLEO|nr:hypothetical protein K491DRAFT_782176 [Lophiostoma macrostomum CBS 122681]
MTEQQPTPGRSISPGPIFEPLEGYTPRSSQGTDSLVQRNAPTAAATMHGLINPALIGVIGPEDTASKDMIMTYVNRLRSIKSAAEREIEGMKSAASLATSGTSSASASTMSKKRKGKSLYAWELEIDSDESDEDDGMDDEFVPPHDPASEPLPKLPTYHPGFDLAGKITKETLQVIEAYIRRSGYTDNEATHLLEEIKSHSCIPYDGPMRIGLVGDAGVGKSSTINSLLGITGLAEEGADSASCTNVVTEYSQASPTQSTPFEGEVEFFSRELGLKMTAQLAAMGIQCLIKQRTCPNEIDYGEVENANTARECLQDLFAAHPEFGSAETAEEFLSSATSESDPKIMSKIYKWTNEILNYFVKGKEHTVTLRASISAQLYEKYQFFTKKVDFASYNGHPIAFSPWPLTLMKQGVRLADCPGYSDINRFRVEATKRYLQACDLTIVVANIDRPLTNIEFKRQYMEAFPRRRSGSVMMVITKSDNLNTENKTYIEFSPADKEHMDTIEQTIGDLDVLIRETKGEVQKKKALLKQRSNEKEGPSQREETDIKKGRAIRNTIRKTIRKLDVKISKMQKRRKALEQESLRVRIVARNKKVAHAVRQNYRLDTGDEARAPVFCISNRVYRKHREGYQISEAPCMSLDESQAPPMRSFVYALPAMGKFATLDHYCGNSVHTLLSMIQMSCSTTTIARKEHLISIVRQSADDLGKQIMDLTSKFVETDVNELVTELTKNDPHSLPWSFIKAARALCRRYEREYGAMGHRAFVRHNGTWKTKKFPQGANWNDAFLSSVCAGIDRLFGKLHDDACSAFKAEIAQVIKEVMTGLNTKLKNDPQALICNTYKKCFLNNFDRFSNSMAQQVAKFKDVRAIQVRTVTDGPEHYFSDAMIEIYEKCDIKTPTAKGKSNTLHKSRCEIFENLVCDPEGPFRTVSDAVHEDMHEAVDQNVRALKRGLNSVLIDIKKQFEVMSTHRDNDTPECQEFRQGLHLLADEARAVMDGPVQEALDLCRQYK